MRVCGQNTKQCPQKADQKSVNLLLKHAEKGTTKSSSFSVSVISNKTGMVQDDKRTK